MAEPNLPDNKAIIYALIDPSIDDPVMCIRYIGATTKYLTRRLSVHLSEARRSKTSYYRLRWLRSLLNRGVVPQIVELEMVDTNVWQEAEIRMISKYRSLGCVLTNATDGGEGIVNPSDETRRKIGFANRNASDETRLRLSLAQKGKKASKESREKMSRARKGKPGPPLSAEAKRKISLARMGNKHCLGHRHSAESKAKMSLGKMGNTGRKGIPHSDETKKLMREQKSGEGSPSAKLNWAQVRAIRATYALGNRTQQELADQYKITLGTINPLLHGRTWIEQ